MRKVYFETDHFYHVYNRGVDKRVIFQKKQDYYRFIHYLYEFNNRENIINLSKLIYRKDKRERKMDIKESEISVPISLRNRERVPLLDIICFCLMPNHFHLIVRQIIDGGVSKFMQKVCVGYAMYFNQKNKRTGALFEGRFKAKHIESDEYLMHLSRYIHLNPVKLIKPDWKEKGILESEWGKIKDFLEKYKWSSYLDYIGKKNFPSVINKSIILEQFKDERAYEEFVASFVTDGMALIKDLL